MTPEQEFRIVYSAWLRQTVLAHSRTARLRFAVSFPGLCGQNTSLFHRGYDAFLAARGVPDSLEAFVQYCARRWRLAGPTRRALLDRFVQPRAPQPA